MTLTKQDSFLYELTKLFDTARNSGKSLYITMKKYDGRTTRNPRLPRDKPKKINSKKTQVKNILETNQHKCLIRAKLGNKKMSCVVEREDLPRFQMLYSNLIKGNINGLKKSTANK